MSEPNQEGGGGIRSTVGAAVALALLVLAYLAYTVDCRRSSGHFEESCYQQGIFSVLNKELILGGVFGAGGFALGFNVPNPMLDKRRRREFMQEFHLDEQPLVHAPGPELQPAPPTAEPEPAAVDPMSNPLLRDLGRRE